MRECERRRDGDAGRLGARPTPPEKSEARIVPVRHVVEEADPYQAITLYAQGQIDIASTTVCVFGRAIEQVKFVARVG
jgi:hypothetical protein